MKTFFQTHPVLCAMLLMLVTLTPLMILRDFTPANELRYLSIADEAISGGNVFTFSNQGMAYADKPPLYFWIIMLCRILFGSHCMYALSMFSFIPAMVIIAVMDRWMLLVRDQVPGMRITPQTRFAMALMLGTSALFLGMTVFLRMDMLMCMFIVLSMFIFYKMYRGIGNNTLHSYLLPVFIFLALFTKGPVGLLVPLVSIPLFLLFSGRIRDYGKYLGIKSWAIIIALCAMWFAGVWFEGGKPYLDNLLFHQTVDRAVNAFHHKEPFWYYLVSVWYVIAPYSLMCIPVFAASFFMKGYRTDAERIFAVAAVSTLLMLSAFSSKLAIYLAPVFPFVIYAFPLIMNRCRWNGWLTASLAIPSAVLAVAGASAMAILPMRRLIPQLSVLDSYTFLSSPAIYIALGLLAAGGCVSLYFLFKSRSWQSPVISVAVSMLLCVFSASFEMSRINDVVGYRNLCAAASEAAEQTGVDKYVTLFVYRPENMDVFFHKDIIDYGHDVDGYIRLDAGNDILIVTTSRVDDYPELASVLEGRRFRIAGDYSIYYPSGQ